MQLQEGEAPVGVAGSGAGWLAKLRYFPLAECLVLIVAAVYAPSIRGEFLWDDSSLIAGVSNAFGEADTPVTIATQLRAIWSGHGQDYFPLTSTLLLFESKLWDMDTRGYHAVNMALHASAVVLLWLVLCRLRVRGAWIGALLFAIHPVCVESVAWISETKNTLCLAFFAGALLAYLRFEERPGRGRYLLALALFLLSLLAKTASVTLPAVLLLCAWWLRDRITRQDANRSLPFFAASLGLGIATLHMASWQIALSPHLPPMPLADRISNLGLFLGFYLSKAVWPVDLMTLYPRLMPMGIFPDLILLAAAVGLWLFRKETAARCAAFALAYYFIALLPTLGLLQMSFWSFAQVADRFQYFGLIGITALAGAAIASLPGRLPVRAAAGAAAAGALVWLTVLQQQPYRNEEAMWKRQIELTPLSSMALDMLGNALLRHGRVTDARLNLEAAIAIDPANPYAHFDLGQVLILQHKITEAITEYEETRQLWPNSAAIATRLAVVYSMARRYEDSAKEIRAALEITPSDASLHDNLGLLLVQLGRREEGIQEFREALNLDPALQGAGDHLKTALKAGP
jgi:tetratricopeptide (TPR) repeat protein